MPGLKGLGLLNELPLLSVGRMLSIESHWFCVICLSWSWLIANGVSEDLTLNKYHTLSGQALYTSIQIVLSQILTLCKCFVVVYVLCKAITNVQMCAYFLFNINPLLVFPHPWATAYRHSLLLQASQRSFFEYVHFFCQFKPPILRPAA